MHGDFILYVDVAFTEFCLRVYPGGFGRRLLELWLSADHTPAKVLRTANQDVVNEIWISTKSCMNGIYKFDVIFSRTKCDANTNLSDRELFQKLPMNDPWTDADILSTFEYLWCHSKTQVPDTWLGTMTEFRKELYNATTGSKVLIDHYNSLVST